MAKTKQTKKTKQEEFNKDLKVRLLSAFGLFLIPISAMQLGAVGDAFHYVFAFCFGSFSIIVYLLLLVLAGYVLIYAKLPIIKGPRLVGSCLLIVGILLLMSLPSKQTDVGIGVISNYIDTRPMNQGGFVGVLFYSMASALFAYMGALIAGVFCLLTGGALLGAKIYFEYFSESSKNKKTKNKKSVQKIRIDNKPYTVQKQKENKILDFFTRKDDKDGSFFPDEVFEDNEKLNQFKNEVIKEKPVVKPLKEEPIKIHQSIPTQYSEPVVEKVIEKQPEEEIQVMETTSVVKQNKNYRLPPLSLLKAPGKTNGTNNKNSALENAERLITVLREFGVNAIISDVFIGPSVTKYELKLETGTRVNKILQLQDDIKLALAARDIRIEAPIPGKSAIGIEIPNSEANAVSFKEVFKDIPESLQSNKLLVPLGKDVSGSCIFAELNKMPHLLIAGATGSGKSVCINTIICSILMRAKPHEVRLILVDPKKVELAGYNGVPHLLTPVCTDAKKAASILREVVSDMERRYDVFASSNVRNIETYNNYVERFNETANQEDKKEKLAYHVVILDEVADLMMVASKDVEDCIMRIAQMARAAGIHLIVATQRPSTDVITGVIKANIPSRIAFAVSSSIDSRTILDCTGAEKLLGKGDMLFSPMGTSFPTRVQGAYVSDQEVEDIVYHTKKQQEVTYDEKFVNVKETSSSTSSKEDQEDEEYTMCRDFVISVQKASTSLLQRQFRIGYNKAARIIDQLESDGVIGPQIGSKPREVFIRGYQEENI